MKLMEQPRPSSVDPDTLIFTVSNNYNIGVRKVDDDDVTAGCYYEVVLPCRDPVRAKRMARRVMGFISEIL